MKASAQSKDNKLTDEIWQARVDLTAAFHLAVHFGLHEAIDNHFTMMVPGGTDRFFLHPYGIHWSEIKPDTLMVVSENGERLEGEGFVDPSAHLIHWPIHKARPDAVCVMHTHMPYASALASLKKGRLKMCHQNSLRFYGKVAYDDHYDGLVFDRSQGDHIAAMLGPASVLFMAHHGVIVVGGSVAEAFHRLYFLERACMVQLLAMSSGEELDIVADEDAKKAVREFDEWDQHSAVSHFDALKRILRSGEGAPKIFKPIAN